MTIAKAKRILDKIEKGEKPYDATKRRDRKRKLKAQKRLCRGILDRYGKMFLSINVSKTNMWFTSDTHINKFHKNLYVSK